jgi:hypothetical protein
MAKSVRSRNLVALSIHVIRDGGVDRVSIFSEGRREEGFDFYRKLLPAIERLSSIARGLPPAE